MQNTSAGDVPLWLFIASRSKIKFLACSTSAYRITPNSISRQGTYTKRYLFSKSVIQTRRQFIENYPVSLRVKRKIEKTDIINELTYTYVTRDYNNFLKLFIKLLRKFYFSRKSIILFLGFLNSRFYVKISDKFKLT